MTLAKSKRVDELFSTAMLLFWGHINNGGNFDYSSKLYGYLNDELDFILVRWYKEEPDGDQQERERGKSTSEEEVISILEHRINTIKEETTINNIHFNQANL